MLAAGLVAPIYELGHEKIGRLVGCDKRTVRRAGSQETLPRLDTVANLARIPGALDRVFAEVGKQLVDIEPRPLDWHEIATTAASIAEIYRRAMEKHGRPTHQDEPKLKELTRRMLALGQGACR